MKTTVKRGLVLRYLVPGLLLSEEEQQSDFGPGQTASLAGTPCGVCGYSAGEPGPWEEMGLGGTKPTELGGGRVLAPGLIQTYLVPPFLPKDRPLTP